MESNRREGRQPRTRKTGAGELKTEGCQKQAEGSEENELKIVAFYSFKGGVGRSLSLLNVACQLSRRGLRIGLVDLDIEACGLNHILQMPARDDQDLLSLLVPENR